MTRKNGNRRLMAATNSPRVTSRIIQNVLIKNTEKTTR